LTAGLLKKLSAGGFSMVSEVRAAGVDGLMKLPGVGEKTASKIFDLVNV